MAKFQSFLIPAIEAYMADRKASGKWCSMHEVQLLQFDRHCSKMCPGVRTEGLKLLSQEMVDSWCAQRDTECNNSCITRIGVVSGFIKYLRIRGMTDVDEPVFPKKEKNNYIPHAFTIAELENFFRACDNLPTEPHLPVVFTRKITVPVFFRLLYSSGIRTNEARMLHVHDVNLEQGILSIKRSKGESQHFVVLHETMTELMIRYDVKIRKIHPDRQYFFPSPKGFLRSNWVCKNFRECWFAYNTSYATAYGLRHHYATENINQWVGKGFGFDSKLLYLSRSMGHSVLESTRYYYSLIPAMSDIVENLSGQNFDSIVPEVDYEESR